MPVFPSLLSQDDIRSLSRLQVLAREVVEGFCSGLHKSPHKGFSVEFRQHRAYVPGDEIRHLDWKVYGKSDRFYIREYEEETNLRATILLDASGSMGYGEAQATKLDYARRLAACLATLMLAQADGVGLAVFDDRVRHYIPPRSRPGHLRVLSDVLETLRPGNETDPASVFRSLVPKLQRRGLLLVLSDCFGPVAPLLKSLAHFRHAHHEVIVFAIWHPDELHFPFQRWTRFECLEQADRQRLLDPVQLRQTYLKRFAAFREELTTGCRRHKVDLVPMPTDRPCAEALGEYLARHRRRA